MAIARKVSHRVIFMDAGKIVEDCAKQDFFDNVDQRLRGRRTSFRRSCSTEGLSGLSGLQDRPADGPRMRGGRNPNGVVRAPHR
jgi:hypothetical protein